MGWWLPAALALFAMVFTVTCILLARDQAETDKKEQGQNG